MYSLFNQLFSGGRTHMYNFHYDGSVVVLEIWAQIA